MNIFQVMPLSLWIMAAASGLVIIILTVFMHLFYRKRLQAIIKSQKTVDKWRKDQKDQQIQYKNLQIFQKQKDPRSY